MKKMTLLNKVLMVLCIVIMFCNTTYGAQIPVNTLNMYDVVVIGSDPEGIAAALSSARNGKQTVLIDTRDRVGGLFTLGGLNSLDMNYGPGRVLLTQGIFKEFFDALDPINATGDFWNKRDSFDVEQAEEIFLKMLLDEPNLTLVLGVKEMTPIVSGNTIQSIRVKKGNHYEAYIGERYIDCTQDADIAAAAGVPYFVGGEDINEPQQIQAITQVFRMENVDWDVLTKAIKENASYKADANRYSAWGFLDQMKAYPSVHGNVKVRGLNIGLQNDGSVLINAMQLIGFDPLDPVSLQEAEHIAEEEVVHIAHYISSHIPGFENATYGGVTEEFYIRESRHIEGEYTLTISDMMKHTNFEDKIAWGGYPVDIQTTDINNWGYVIGDPVAYSIPFRCIVPKKIDNLLVASRSASYHSIGFGSVRVVPIGMAVAEAAGVAAVYSIDTGMSFREMAYNTDAIKWVQQCLKRQGAYLEDLSIPYQYEGHWAEKGIDFCYELGLIIGSYSNELQLEAAVTDTEFMDAMKLVGKRGEVQQQMQPIEVSNVMITPNQAAEMVLLTAGKVINLPNKPLYLKETNVISMHLYEKMKEAPLMTREMMYQFLYELHTYATTVKKGDF